MADRYPKLERSWVWPESVERWFRARAEGYTLHVCCGTSNLGDVTVDADRDHKPDVQSDMNALPFPDCTFDTAIWDPPWKMDPYSRNPPYFEVVRCVKPDGKVLANTQWIPESHQTTVDTVWVRQDLNRGFCSQLWELTRWPGQTTLGGEASA